MTTFTEKRIGTNETSFWEPIPRLKVKSFNSTNKNICMRSKEKLVTVNADRNFFGRLLIVSNVRQIDIKEVLSYELSPVPFFLAHQHGSVRKTAKSVLSSILEKDINVLPRLPASPHSTVQIIDGMAIVQMTKSEGCTTFGELAAKYFDIFTAALSAILVLKSMSSSISIGTSRSEAVNARGGANLVLSR